MEKISTREELIERFGLQAVTAGIRPRGIGIVTEIELEEEIATASIGDLHICTRDNGIEDIDKDACELENFVGMCDDTFDCTYLHYYFSPLKK